MVSLKSIITTIVAGDVVTFRATIADPTEEGVDQEEKGAAAVDEAVVVETSVVVNVEVSVADVAKASLSKLALGKIFRTCVGQESVGFLNLFSSLFKLLFPLFSASKQSTNKPEYKSFAQLHVGVHDLHCIALEPGIGVVGV